MLKMEIFMLNSLFHRKLIHLCRFSATHKTFEKIGVSINIHWRVAAPLIGRKRIYFRRVLIKGNWTWISGLMSFCYCLNLMQIITHWTNSFNGRRDNNFFIPSAKLSLVLLVFKALWDPMTKRLEACSVIISKLLNTTDSRA